MELYTYLKEGDIVKPGDEYNYGTHSNPKWVYLDAAAACHVTKDEALKQYVRRPVSAIDKIVAELLKLDADNPQRRAKALEGAAAIASRGWHVWVENTLTGKRIFDNAKQKET